MGLKSLHKLTPTPTREVPVEIVELTRMSVLETLVADFYHSSDEHVKSAIDLHKEVAEKYPNFYLELFSDPAFLNYFLDAHKAMSMPYLLYHHDEEALDTALEAMKNIQVNRIGNAYEICRMPESFGVDVPKSVLRKLFYKHAWHIEDEKGADYVGYLAVKYAKELKKIFAVLRVKKEELSPVWQDAMIWVFTRDTTHNYEAQALKEASRLRKYVQEGKQAKRLNVKSIPFTVWMGYAKQLGFSEEDIFKRYDLMTRNEVKRNLATLEKYGLMTKTKDKKAIQKKVQHAELDLLTLFYTLKVLDNTSKEVLMNKGKQEYERQVNDMQRLLKDKKVSIAVDCSMGGSGFSNLFTPEMQKRVARGENVPAWAKTVQRESFNANVVLAKILAEASKKAKVYMFNESVEETPLPATFEQLVEELKEVKPEGGSNILRGLQTAVEDNPDFVFVITDMNENVPFQGALRSQLETIAKGYGGTIVFIATENIVERNIATMIDDLIKEKKLTNVMVVPVKKAGQLVKGFVIIEIVDKAKKIFVEVEVKKKKKKKKGAN